MKIGGQHFPNLVQKPSGFYWDAPPASRVGGFGSIPLGKELDATALGRYLTAQKALARWRQVDQAENAPPPIGTVDRILWDYMLHRWYTKKSAKTRSDYRNKLHAMANFRLLDGSRFGDQMWREIEAIHTDKLYELMCYADDGGLRETYARAVMHTARIVWNWAQRYLRKEFEFNPFDGMRLETPDARTVRWEPAQVWQFCRMAEEMGLLSAALVAVFCYELGQRPGDARKMCRSCFEGDALIVVEQGKTGKRLLLPVSDVLAEFVAKVPGDRNELVVNERTGRQYEDYELSKIAAEIREAAKLPGHLWIADLRRTCLTELGRLGASDDQLISVSGHSQRQMLSTYSLTEYRKAVDIMQRRRSLRNAA
jgi:hypothetical protein